LAARLSVWLALLAGAAAELDELLVLEVLAAAVVAVEFLLLDPHPASAKITITAIDIEGMAIRDFVAFPAGWVLTAQILHRSGMSWLYDPE
jgi:hypothetical protein